MVAWLAWWTERCTASRKRRKGVEQREGEPARVARESIDGMERADFAQGQGRSEMEVGAVMSV